MQAKKLVNPDGSTRKIIVAHTSGSFSSYIPKEAAEMISLLREQLWRGIPMNKKDTWR